jgi:multicomponent Na+:H+ antiporter subunit D
MSGWLAVPVAAPLLAAGLLVLVRDRQVVTRTVAVAATAGVLAIGIGLLVATHDGTVLSQDIGGWPRGVSIMFAADQFSALMLTVTALLVLVCLSFAFALRDDRHRLFLPLVLALSAGVYGAYLTADLFNLFVFIEVMLAPSYVLMVLTGGRQRLAAGRIYLTVSLLASTIYLVGIGLLYGVTGTVNLGDLAGLGRESKAVALAGGVLLVAMATKAAVAPLHGWLPRAYPHASPAVTALFSGLLTKVGIYAIFRIYAVVYDGDPRYGWLIMTGALLSAVVGALGAMGERSFRSVLLFSMVSHVGFMLVGPALFTTLGLAAAIFYLLQYVLVKAALLVCAGAVEATYGTGRLDRLGGLVSRAPLLAVCFMVPALSLAGVPPLSGFVAKLSLIRAAVAETQYLAAALVVVVGLLTLLAMTKIWNSAFWGHDGEATWGDDSDGQGAVAVRVRTSLMIPAMVLAGFSVLLGIGAEPLLVAAETAADGLVDTTAYVEAVTGR